MLFKYKMRLVAKENLAWWSQGSPSCEPLRSIGPPGEGSPSLSDGCLPGAASESPTGLVVHSTQRRGRDQDNIRKRQTAWEQTSPRGKYKKRQTMCFYTVRCLSDTSQLEGETLNRSCPQGCDEETSVCVHLVLGEVCIIRWHQGVIVINEAPYNLI